MTNDSITIIHEGKSHTVQRGAPHFSALRKAIIEESWDDIPKNLTVTKSLKEWARGKFTIEDSTVSYNGTPIPSNLNKRIIAMATKGEDPNCLFNFWERLQKNPSYRSVNQLWDFLIHEGIPLTEDGCFLAYKSVRDDYKDHHTGRFDNTPGTVQQMPRNQISDDPKVPCHEGFHVGALAYATSTWNNARIVVCKIDPEDVVCVPYDHSHMKMRVSKYEVIGNHGGDALPSTTFKEEEYPPDVDEELEEEEPEDEVDNEEEEPEDETDDEADDEADTDAEAGDEDDEVEDKEETEQEESKKEESKRKPSRGFAKLDKLDMTGLLEKSIDELRKYATKGLQIVGASKIPGGKVALVGAILKVRE